VHVDDDRSRCAGLRQLFDADGEREGVEARPPVLPWDEDAHQARSRCRLHRLVGEPVVAIDLFRNGLDDALGQLAHGCPEGRMLRRQFEVQLNVN